MYRSVEFIFLVVFINVFLIRH